MPKVLLVDDEEPLRESLSFSLTKEGFDVLTASDGPSALALATAHGPDIVLLDVMLPGMDGIEVCRRLRETSDLPILMLTAKDQVIDKIEGLETGADDYITKPFNTRELIARIRALIRRRASIKRLIQEDRELLDKMTELVETVEEKARVGLIPVSDAVLANADVVPQKGELRFGPFHVSLENKQITYRDNLLDLSPNEFQLLFVLLTRPNRVCTRTELIAALWGDYSSDAVSKLEYLVRQLREKTELDPGAPRHIVAIPGIGYQLE
jgi:two-component system response regulator RegX3